MKFENVSAKSLPVYVIEENARTLSCEGCRNGKALDFDFTMAFQPLVDVDTGEVFSYEALVRGKNIESAASVISQVNAQNIYKFDQTCRVKAIAVAAEKGLTAGLNINFLPGAVYRPDICIRTTLVAAENYGFPLQNITFELVETDHISDLNHLKNVVNHYREIGFSTAIDDFGSGYANLDWLAELSPDKIKIDMALIRGIDHLPKKQLIVSAIKTIAEQMDILVMAEGVETKEERDYLYGLGVTRQQGYFFAKPAFESFEPVNPESLR